MVRFRVRWFAVLHKTQVVIRRTVLRDGLQGRDKYTYDSKRVGQLSAAHCTEYSHKRGQFIIPVVCVL